MNDEEFCPKCHDNVENGALFCGNCGFKLVASNNKRVDSLALANGISVPTYAFPHSHYKQHWAAMSLALCILAVSFSYLVPILGLGLAIAGLMMSTSSYRVTHSWLKVGSLIFAILAIMISIGFWVRAVVNEPKLSSTASQANKTSVNVVTPCYQLTFSSLINTNNTKGGCSLTAYNGQTLNKSSGVLNITASNVNNLNNRNFINYARNNLSNYISNEMPSYLTTTNSSDYFASNPSYYLKAYSSYTNNSVILEAIYVNKTGITNKDNYFLIRYIKKGQSVNLNNFEKTWSWNR